MQQLFFFVSLLCATSLFAKAPDLLLTDLTGPENITQNSTTKVSYDYWNKGDTAASQHLSIFYLSKDTLADASDSQIGRYESNYPIAVNSHGFLLRKELTIPSGLADGTYYILAVIDGENKVSEPNEKNNIAFLKVQLGKALPDFRFDKPVIGSSMVPGHSYNFTAYLTNVGSIAASSPMRVLLSTDTLVHAQDVTLGASSAATLSPMQQSELPFRLPLPAKTAKGKYWILFVADPANETLELNEANNVYKVPITVEDPFYDLTPVFSPSSGDQLALSGRLFSSFYTNQNKGNTDIGFQTGFYLSSDSVYDATDRFLGAKKDTVYAEWKNQAWGSVTIDPSVAPGNYYLIMKSDYDNKYPERDETNNYHYLKFRLEKPYQDFTLENISFATSSQATAQEPLSFQINEKGNVSSRENKFVSISLSADSLADPTDQYFYQDVNVSNSFTGNITLPSVFDKPLFLIIQLAIEAHMTENQAIEDTSNNTIIRKISPAPITGIEQADIAKQVHISPNPTSDMVRVWGNEHLRKILVYTAEGFLIGTYEATEGVAIDMSHLPHGLYFLHVLDSEHTLLHRQKVVFE